LFLGFVLSGHVRVVGVPLHYLDIRSCRLYLGYNPISLWGQNYFNHGDWHAYESASVVITMNLIA
jgi:hypothetical protein